MALPVRERGVGPSQPDRPPHQETLHKLVPSDFRMWLVGDLIKARKRKSARDEGVHGVTTTFYGLFHGLQGLGYENVHLLSGQDYPVRVPLPMYRDVQMPIPFFISARFLRDRPQAVVAAPEVYSALHHLHSPDSLTYQQLLFTQPMWQPTMPHHTLTDFPCPSLLDEDCELLHHKFWERRNDWHTS